MEQRGKRKELLGIVVDTKMDKTIKGLVERFAKPKKV